LAGKNKINKKKNRRSEERKTSTEASRAWRAKQRELGKFKREVYLSPQAIERLGGIQDDLDRAGQPGSLSDACEYALLHVRRPDVPTLTNENSDEPAATP